MRKSSDKLNKTTVYEDSTYTFLGRNSFFFRNRSNVQRVKGCGLSICHFGRCGVLDFCGNNLRILLSFEV